MGTYRREDRKCDTAWRETAVANVLKWRRITIRPMSRELSLSLVS